MAKFLVRGTSECFTVYKCQVEIEAESYDAALAAARDLDCAGKLPWEADTHDDGPSVFEATPADVGFVGDPQP